MLAFGPFKFDPSTGELWKAGELVHVPPQPTAALRLLVSRPGALISREEFRQAIWAGVDHLDFNAGLNFCIGQLRGILGDRGPAPQYIVAVPKRGYRFIASVDVAAGGPVEQPKPAGTARRSWTALAAAGAAGFIAIVAIGSRTPAAASAGTSDLLAAKAVVRATAGLADAGPSEIAARIAMFDEAIGRDAKFAEAFSGRAHALLLQGHYRERTPAAAYAEALVYSRRAIALAPRLASAHAVYGAALIYSSRDWTEGRRQLREAMALDDRLAVAHQWYSRSLSAAGRHAEAVSEARRAVALAPASASAHTDLGLALFYSGEFTAAVAACSEAAGLLPAFVPARTCMNHATVESAADNDAYWRGKLDRLETAMAGGMCSCDEPLLAVPLAHLGDADRALDVLERGADRTSDTVLFAAVHPAFARLRTTPRFQYLVRRLGLPVS
jgi:DNA-binding winged helix-turn-helix (wHTH) protein/tetratricopeptide (TPR) repeat protein